MSDRQNDVLAAIDAETAKCICGNTIPADGASLDYCSPPCQYGYLASRVGDTPDPEVASSRTTTTDGRAINEEVNRRFQPGADTEDVYGDLMAMVAERLGRTARSFSFPDTRYASTFQRTTADNPDATHDRTNQVSPTSHTTSDLAETIRNTMGIPGSWANRRLEVTTDEWIPTEADHELAAAVLTPRTEQAAPLTFETLRRSLQEARDAYYLVENETNQPVGLRFTVGRVTYTSTGYATRLPDGSIRFRGSFDTRRAEEEPAAEQQQPVEDEADSTTSLMWVPGIADSNAPTAAELATGVNLTPYIVAFEDTAWAAAADPRPAIPCRVYWASHGCKLERGHRGPHRCDPDCPPIDPRYEPYGEDAGPDQFRHRALAARQNRATGPTRRDNRRWRNR